MVEAYTYTLAHVNDITSESPMVMGSYIFIFHDHVISRRVCMLLNTYNMVQYTVLHGWYSL